MASYSMHLAIAKIYLKYHKEENIEEFLKGSIDPDLAPFDEKGRTHYGIHAAWANPAKYLNAIGGKLNTSYKRGYFLHLVTDYIFYHKLAKIDEVVSEEELTELLNNHSVQDVVVKTNIDEWRKKQRNDFSILEGEVVEKYQIEDWTQKLPEQIKKEMLRKEGELQLFERTSLFKFFEDMGKLDLNELASALIQKPDTKLVEYYENIIASKQETK